MTIEVTIDYVNSVVEEMFNWLKANAYEKVDSIRAERINAYAYEFVAVKQNKEFSTCIMLPCNSDTLAMATATIYNKIHGFA